MPILRCIVPGCPSISPDTQMFRITLCPELLVIWMKYLLPILPGLRSCTRMQLSQKPICIRHFEAKYINGNKRLRYGVPTLFTKEEIESGIPTQPLKTEPTQMLNEHSYSYMKPREDHTYCKDAEREETDNMNLYVQETNTDWPDAADEDYGPSHPVHGITPHYEGSDDIITHEDPISDDEKPKIPSRTQKYNNIQQYMDEFIKEIEDEVPPNDNVCPLFEDTAPKGKFAAELENYNFSAEVIDTNICVKPYDTMEHLMYPEKAYAAITYCILKQQELLEESISDFLTWATNSVLDYGCLQEKVAEIFENGEFFKLSLKILQIVCKYRLKNVEMRKESIVNQLLEPEMKETLSNIRHTSTHLFDAETLMFTLYSASTIQRLFVPKKSKQKLHKHDRGTQANILPQKASKHVQVKPKKARKAAKAVQVNSNELEGIATATKVKKKDTGSQTSEKDRLLGETMLYRDNLPLRERLENETVDDSPLSHCQKIQYVVKIKRKPPHSEGATNRSMNMGSLEPNTQAGPEPNECPRHVSNDYNRKEMVIIENRDSQNSHHGPKKKRKSVKRAPDPSMPVLWDACENLLSLGGSNITETEAENVHSTLERKSVTPKRPGRPHFGKKRRPKIPEGLKEQTSSTQSVGISPMQGTSESFHLPGKSVDPMHICDSPYLLGGCKHTYDPRTESVPPSSVQRGLSIQSSSYSGSTGGKLLRNALSQPSGSASDAEVPSNPDYQGPNVIILPQNQVTEETNQGSSTPLLLLTYDNLLSRWAPD